MNRRPKALPLARLVSQAEVIADERAAIERLNQPDFDPSRAMIVSEALPCEPSGLPDTTAKVEVLEASPDQWRISSSSDVPALLVVAESSFPGWQATIADSP